MIDVAKRAAQEAGEIILKVRRGPYRVVRKGTKENIITEADTAANAKIVGVIHKKFPKHNILSEETGLQDNGSGFQWVIDPLDGTGSFFVGLPYFGVSIGLLKNGKPYLGVVNFPEFKATYWASRGIGAYKNDRAIKVSAERDLAKVMVGFDLGWSGVRQKELKKFILPLADKVWYCPTLGCTVAGMCYVSEGVFGGYIHRAYVWDFTASAAIIQEAGGKITDDRGRSVNWLANEMTLIASNGLIHDQIIKKI